MRRCECGCGASIEHLRPQARYVDDTHRKRAERAPETRTTSDSPHIPGSDPVRVSEAEGGWVSESRRGPDGDRAQEHDLGASDSGAVSDMRCVQGRALSGLRQDAASQWREGCLPSSEQAASGAGRGGAGSVGDEAASAGQAIASRSGACQPQTSAGRHQVRGAWAMTTELTVPSILNVAARSCEARSSQGAKRRTRAKRGLTATRRAPQSAPVEAGGRSGTRRRRRRRRRRSNEHDQSGPSTQRCSLARRVTLTRQVPV
jgi:hypothetical protein